MNAHQLSVAHFGLMLVATSFVISMLHPPDVLGADNEFIASTKALVKRGLGPGREEDSLAAFVLAPAGQIFNRGTEIPLVIGIVRVGGESGPGMAVWPIHLPCEPLNWSWFTVVGPDGIELEYSGPMWDYAPWAKDRAVRLHVGDILGKVTTLRHFKMDGPGKYHIRWNYHGAQEGAWQGTITSNEVELEVR